MAKSPALISPAAGYTDAGPQAASYLERLLVPFSIIAVAVFIAVGIDRSVWLDEANSILIASRPFAGIVESLRRDNNFPLYYFVLALWMRLFGDSEIALRALSAIFYLAGGAVTFALGKRASTRTRTGAYAALFYFSSVLAVRQAQNIRMYALLGMLSGLSTLLYLRLFFAGDRSRRAKAFLILVNAVGILTHVWFSFVLAAQFLALARFHARRLGTWMGLAILAGLPFLFLWFPQFLDQLRNGATSWMPALQARALVVAPLELFGLLRGILLYGLAGSAWLLADQKRKESLRATLVPPVFVVFAVALALPLLVSVLKPIYAPGRYVIIALAPLAVVFAVVLTSLLPRILITLLAFGLLTVGMADQVLHRDEVPDADLPHEQSDRVTAQFILQRAAPGDAIVFTSLTQAAADYYIRRGHAETRFTEISFPEEVSSHLGWADPTVSAGRRVRLESEAEVTSRRLQVLIRAGHRVWMYYGAAPLVSEILHRKLDSALKPPREYALEGPYHRSILEYSELR